MTDEPSNTTPKQQGGITGKGFVKGDPRINRNGRPKSFDQLRKLAQLIAHERIADGSTITAAEAILRQLAHEKPERFIEIAFGKVPDETVNSGEIKHTIRIEYVDAATAPLAPGAIEDQT